MHHPNSWQAIYGNFDFTTKPVLFHGGLSPDEEDPNRQLSEVGLAMTDLTFSGGNLLLEFSYSSVRRIPHVRAVLYRNPIDGSTLTAGLDGGSPTQELLGRYSFSIYDASKGSGKRSVLASTDPVPMAATGTRKLKVSHRGSILDLYADGVLLLRHLWQGSMPRSQCGVQCVASSDLQINEFAAETGLKSAFVVMQFSAPFENLFTEVIKPVAQACGYAAEKADDKVGPGLIIADIIRQIQDCDLVIADITPENPNVFYEVGFAHAIHKPTILLAERGRKLPFDVTAFRTLFYDNSIAGKGQIESGLRRHIEAIAREGSIL